jgi:hypothetical protein
MIIDQIVSWGGVTFVVVVMGLCFFVIDRRWRKLRRQVIEAREEYERFEAETMPCDKCLGTGRAPKEGRCWPPAEVERFNKELELEKIPKQFLDAFKD